MAAHYEWDVETVTDSESAEHEENEVLDHWFVSSYAEAVALAAGESEPGMRFDVVLVRHADECTAWAYVEDGKLPEYFEDAYGAEIAKVPTRFHSEVVNAP